MLSLSFAKLVATPTDASWSQVYNAGNLFAALSLTKNGEEENSLSSIGKDIFSNLEAEFFTLEDKNLESIKQAILSSTGAVAEGIVENLSVAFFKNNILYVFIFGEGKIVMKRGDKTGVLLEKKSYSQEMITASGLLQNDDVIVLQTPQFAADMSIESVASALNLELPNDMAESLSPAMHEKDDGGQAAIIIKYKDAKKPIEEEAENDGEQTIAQEPTHQHVQDDREYKVSQTDMTEPESTPLINPKKPLLSGFSLSSLTGSIKPLFLKNKNTIHLNHRKKLFLSVAVIILVILTMSILFTKQREENGKTAMLFESIYTPALKDYEDGKAVQSINKIFARDEFLNAQKKLKEGEGKFEKGSKEEKQISELLAKVEAELGGTISQAKITPKQADVGTNDLLSVAKTNSSAHGFTKDKDATHFVTDEAVVSVSGNGTKKDIIENDGDWERPTGIATYQGNMYVLDQTNGVLKFTAGSSGFGKSSYFKTKPSNIGNATAIAIDGSVWILFKDGTIMKFTRGESDGFKVKALDKPFKNPTKIFTNLDTENLYVLDNGNSRIVELNKDGAFQTQYVADILRGAKDFEVSEKDGKILVLSGSKFWEISL